jgi:hypothetical protein
LQYSPTLSKLYNLFFYNTNVVCKWAYRFRGKFPPPPPPPSLPAHFPAFYILLALFQAALPFMNTNDVPGKVLLERLLSAVTGSGRIFLLLRPSPKFSDVSQRLAAILAGPVFLRARERGQNFSELFVAVSGDVAQESLGMSDDDREIVCKCCSVVIHCAATVKFHEHLLDAIQATFFALPPSHPTRPYPHSTFP